MTMIYNLILKLTPPQLHPGLTPSPSPKGEGSLGRGWGGVSFRVK